MKNQPLSKVAGARTPGTRTSQAERGVERKVKKQRAPRIDAAALDKLEQLHLNAAGVDVGSTENYVSVSGRNVKGGEPSVRSFGVFSSDLDETVKWLTECGITTVAMEATGIYWMALYDKLETAKIQVVLVEPNSVKQVPGRKSDVLDCQWLQQLHTYGLLRGSFRPEEPIRQLRSMIRQRLELVQAASRCQLHMQKALVPMNLQLHLVVARYGRGHRLKNCGSDPRGRAGSRDAREIARPTLSQEYG